MEKMFFFDIDDTLYDLAEPFCKTCDVFFKGDLVLPMDELTGRVPGPRRERTIRKKAEEPEQEEDWRNRTDS